MSEIAREDAIAAKKTNSIILPKINKTAQISEHIIKLNREQTRIKMKPPNLRNVQIRDTNPFSLFTYLSKNVERSARVFLEEDNETERRQSLLIKDRVKERYKS